VCLCFAIYCIRSVFTLWEYCSAMVCYIRLGLFYVNWNLYDRSCVHDWGVVTCRLDWIVFFFPKWDEAEVPPLA
jgi:hypothetical protein